MIKGIFESKKFNLLSVEIFDEKLNEFEFSKAAEMLVLFEAAKNMYL